jgi:hypothetical protein
MNDTTISRRDVFRLLAAASTAGAMLPKQAAAEPPSPLSRQYKNPLSDPDYTQKIIPWEKPLTDSELATLTVLVDLILPADEESPAASAIGIPDFLNEWVGAPYEDTVSDCAIIRGGISWINTHSVQTYGNRFDQIKVAEQTAILDSICDPAKTAPELAAGARFFKKLRSLAVGGYYSHSSTWKSIGYVGNVPIPGDYPGTPDEVIRILGLQDVI